MKYLLMTGGLGMMIAAVCILTYDLYREMLYRRALETPGGTASAAPVVIVAERLSDKLQIMMVPADGKLFFANDVLRGMNLANQSAKTEQQPQ